MITRDEIKGRMLRYLNKTPSNQGFYANDKIIDAIQEAMTYIATEMFLANEGWQTKVQFLDTATNQTTVEIPPHMAMINEVRYKVGNLFVPLVYDDANGQAQWADDGGVTQFAATYRVIDNAFVFNPALAEGGTGYLMVE